MSAAGAIGACILTQGLIRLFEQSKLPPKLLSPIKPPLLGLPCAAIITPPPPRPVPPGPPVVQWSSDQELLAWRGWRLALFMPDSGDDYGPRLLSLTATCIWNGPVVGAERPPDAVETPSGIYPLKAGVADRSQLQTTEYCWVTGWVALSGRVVEHALGYRAQRAVVEAAEAGNGVFGRPLPGVCRCRAALA